MQFEADQIASRPQALDDEGTLLYNFSSGAATAPRDARPGVPWQVILQTASGRRTVLADEAVNASYVHPGRVVFMRDGTLMAIRVDLRTGQAIGHEVPVVDGITRLLTTAPTFHVAVSSDGALAYVPGTLGGSTRRRLGFVQLDGRVELLPKPAQKPQPKQREPKEQQHARRPMDDMPGDGNQDVLPGEHGNDSLPGRKHGGRDRMS